VKSFAGLGTVDEFDRSNLDHAMAVQWVEAACLGIEGEGQPGTEGSQKYKERASDLSHMGDITNETKKIPLNALHDARLQTELRFFCALLSASFRKTIRSVRCTAKSELP
jgi:hypothetical protein